MEDFAIKAENVSKTFKLPYEKNNSIKSAVINILSKKRGYEIQKALQNIDFEIKKGEFFGIAGRNGSGKSTLLKLIAGIYSPTQGQVHVRGSLTPFIELGVGFNPELTGRENVFLNGALLGFNRKEMRGMYKDIVEFAELKKFMDQKLKNYSSGMQVRLAFSIAIRAQSDILLIDEVLAVGDAAFQQKCFNYFEELRRRNKTVVLVSHDMNAIRRFCTSAVYIKDGRLTHRGSPAEIADVYTLDNIEDQPTNTDDKPKSDRYKVDLKITAQADNNLGLKISYSSKDKDRVYVGIAVLRDGISVAEITTSPNLKLGNTGKLNFSLDTTILNGGTYQMAVALFRSKNRELVAIGKNREFIIKGHDHTKGAALKLVDTWERE